MISKKGKARFEKFQADLMKKEARTKTPSVPCERERRGKG
jgi:hypothetical protein